MFYTIFIGMKKLVITDIEKKMILEMYSLTEDTIKSESEIKSFQDWMDKNHPGWIKDSDGRYKNLRTGPSNDPNRHVNGKGYGVFGPSTQQMWEKYGTEFSKTNVKQNTAYPYNKLESNPSAQFIAYTIKTSKGGALGNDKEAWAEAAFNSIGSRDIYSKVEKFLGEDPYGYIEAFMDTKEMYHKNPVYDKYITLFPEFNDNTCSPDVIKASNWSNLYQILVKRKMINEDESIIIIWGPTQTLYYASNDTTASLTSKVSTGANGFGNTPDNKQTSTGLLRVSGKIVGKPYEVLVNKTSTGKILGPNIDSTRVDNEGKHHIAEVLTGILELSGLEGCNENTLERNIYIHGTNKENSLGSKHSNGCIRVSNDTIKKLLNSASVNTKVYVYPS